MKNLAKKQHYIPGTYIRQFKIKGIKENYVYCFDMSALRKKYVQKLGPNDSVFIRKKYYHHSSLTDPYSIETVFAEIENDYNHIIEVLKAGESINEATKIQIMVWIFTSKMRSPVIRDSVMAE